MNKRILVTLPGGRVSVVCPSDRAMRVYTSGGVGPDDSNFYWIMNRRGFDDEQMERSVAAGHGEDSIRRHLRAMRFGGLTTAEALALIRDRDCAHRGTGIELWSIDDLPADRWFRDAWRRRANGGPIRIDLEAARMVQQRRMAAAVRAWNEAQRAEPELWGHNGPHIVDMDYGWLQRSCAAAASLDALRAIWPRELMRA